MDQSQTLNIIHQVHTMSWGLLVLFFLLSAIFRKQKALPMILRLFFIIMIVSGIGLLYYFNFPLPFIIKGLLAVVLFGFMEMVLSRQKQGKPTIVHWILTAVLLAVVLLIAFDVISF